MIDHLQKKIIFINKKQNKTKIQQVFTNKWKNKSIEFAFVVLKFFKILLKNFQIQTVFLYVKSVYLHHWLISDRFWWIIWCISLSSSSSEWKFKSKQWKKIGLIFDLVKSCLSIKKPKNQVNLAKHHTPYTQHDWSLLQTKKKFTILNLVILSWQYKCL